MLGILKVNAGISTDGTAEFSLTIVDTKDRVYEVEIDDVAYAQVVGVIEEAAGSVDSMPDFNAREPVEEHAQDNGAEMSEDKKAKLASLLAGEVAQNMGKPIPEQFVAKLSDVGFDYDYSAEEEEELDPGEVLDEEYVEPI